MKQPIHYSLEMAERIISERNESGLHPEISRRWAYVPGMTLLALLRAWNQTGEEKYYSFVKTHMDLFVRDDGSIQGYVLEDYNLDQVNQGKVLFPLLQRTGEKRYEQALHLLATQLLSQPRTTDGGFWHKKIYPFQMWLDGLYMSSPFLAEYAAVFQRPELLDEVAHQILLVEKCTRDRNTGLLYHAWDDSKEQRWCDPVTGKSRHFWSRAMGWYSMAVVDALDHFPVDHPKRGTIIGIFERMAEALVRVQDGETGLWYQVLDLGVREGNYVEASGSSMFVYAMAKGVRRGYLSKKFSEVAAKGYQGLLSLTDRDDQGLHLNQICGGAGLGGHPYRDGTYEYYINEKVVRDALMGAAPFMLAGLEVSAAGLA
jgi:unsaturated rhamnogalacturonyl hydrolase